MSGEAESLKFFGLAAANPLLGQMSEPVLKSLMACSVFVEIAADQHLVRQGAQSDAAYLLVDGEVERLESARGGRPLATLLAETAVADGDVGDPVIENHIE